MSGSRSNGNAGEAESSNLPILTRFWNPGSPGFPRLRAHPSKAFPDRPHCLLLFCSDIALIATLKQKPVYAPQVLLEIQKEIQTFPPFRNSTNWTSSPTRYLRSQYHHPGQRKLARSVIDQLRLDTIGEFNAPEWWVMALAQKKEYGGSQVFARGSGSRGSRSLSASAGPFESRLQIDPINRSRR